MDRTWQDYHSDRMSLSALLENCRISSVKSEASTSLNPHECKYCQDVTVKFEPTKNFALRQDVLPYETGNLKLPLLDVVLAAQKGCCLFRWVLDLIARESKDLTAHEQLDPKAYRVKILITLRSYYESSVIPNSVIGGNEEYRSNWSLSKMVQRPLEGAETLHRYQRARSPFVAQVEVVLCEAAGIERVGGREDLHMWSCPDISQASAKPPSITAPVKIEWSKDSAKSFDFARERLRICQTTHINCQSHLAGSDTDAVVAPIRLLQLEELEYDTVRLVDTAQHKPRGGYIALSYCWGGTQPICLNRSNEASLHHGIDIRILAQSIQDALRICRELGIFYLWVDAFCIIQDNETDKQRELGKMAMYYRNSFVTICAASSPSASLGFLSSKAQPAYEVAPMSLTFEEIDANPEYERGVRMKGILSFQTVEKSKGLAGGKAKYQLYQLAGAPNTRQAISKRAWTFQEALLSTRMLVYASDQLYWCCGESYIGCGGPNSSERIVTVRPDCKGRQAARCVCGTSLVREIHDLPIDIFSLDQRRAMSTSAQWDMIVENFSARSLSVESDKLEACAAIASYFGEIFTARWPDVVYAAGIWYSAEHPRSFCRQLLWTSTDPIRARRSRHFRAPSWSWASIDGEVSVFDRHREYMYNEPPSLEVRVLDVEPVSSLTPFGEIKDAVLIVCGKLRSLDLFDPDKTPPDLEISFDTANDQALLQEAGSYHMLEVTPFGLLDDSPRGLLLVPYGDVDSSDVPEFERIGSFSCSKQSEFARRCFEGCEVKTFHIK